MRAIQFPLALAVTLFLATRAGAATPLRDGEPFVFEAIASVRYTPLSSWAARGDGGRCVVRRLKPSPLLQTVVTP